MNPKIFAKLLVRDAFSLLFCSVWQFNLQWSFCLRALTSAHEQIKSELQKFTNSKTGEHPQWRFSLIFYWVDQIREIFWQLDSKRTFLLSLTPPAKIFFFFFSSPSQIRVAKVSDRLIGWAILTENLTDDRDSCAHNWLTFPNTLYLRKQKCPQKKKQINYSTLDVHANEVRCFVQTEGKIAPTFPLSPTSFAGENQNYWTKKLERWGCLQPCKPLRRGKGLTLNR